MLRKFTFACRNLSGEIAIEWAERQEHNKPIDDLQRLVEEILPFDMSHNAENEACDLLIEVEQLDKILPHIDENNYFRVCHYLFGYSLSVQPQLTVTAAQVMFQNLRTQRFSR